MIPPKAVVAILCFFALGTLVWSAQTNTEYPNETWKQTNPASLGWSRNGFRLADELARTMRTSAYLVIHKGQIVHEYGDVTTPTNVHSVRKSILSILFGIYHDQGKIRLESTMSELGVDDLGGLSASEKKATVEQLLQARSGIYHPSAYELAAQATHHPPRGAFAPGTHFEYNNWDFNALGTIFKTLTQKSVFESLEVDLSKPLQFEHFKMARDTSWVYERTRSQHPAYVMRLSARDLGRVGLLMARNGRWKNQQIVSSGWEKSSTTSYSNAGLGIGYGYLWWVGEDGWHFGQKFPSPIFSARGNFGQFLIIDPTRDLVIVHRVNSDPSNHADVGISAFNPLLARILAAGPNLILPKK